MNKITVLGVLAFLGGVALTNAVWGLIMTTKSYKRMKALDKDIKQYKDEIKEIFDELKEAGE